MDSKILKQNVVLMAPVPPPAGGIGRWAERYLNLSKKYNIDVSLCDESVIGKRAVFGKKSHVNFFSEIKRTIKIWKSLKNEIRKFGNNCIVHCCIPAYRNSMRRELVSLKIAKTRKVKFIIHFRSTISNSIKTRKDKKLLKKMLLGCDYCVVLNRPSFDFCLNYISKEKIQIVPNFISSDEIVNKKTISKELNKVVYAGGVIKEKGCDLILDVAEVRRDLIFYLIGNASAEIESIINKKKLTNVKLLGEQSKEVIRKEFDSSDVFLFLSRFSGEGFSNAVVEAMARGLPCIVSDWASNREQIGEMGPIFNLIIDKYNPQAVLKALELLSEQTIRETISRYNINRVKTCYSEEMVMIQYTSIYEKLNKGF